MESGEPMGGCWKMELEITVSKSEDLYGPRDPIPPGFRCVEQLTKLVAVDKA